MRLFLCVVCIAAPALEGVRAAWGEELPLFADMTFRRGFNLSFPSSQMGRRVEKTLDGAEAGAAPVWRLCQWGTRASLAEAPRVRLQDGGLCWENDVKRVVAGGGEADLLLDLRGGAQYEGRARAAGEAWPHLLVEQDAAHVVTLDGLARLELDVSYRLCAVTDHMGPRADPSLHAAQFQLFLIVKDVGPGAQGDYLWFGVPFFDSRHTYPPSHQARDAGKDDATGKFIYTMDGKDVLPAPPGDGAWIRIRKDLRPAILEGLARAVERGFLPHGDPARFAVVNMNMGWEMPGAFDGAVAVRGLSITAVRAAAAAAAADWPQFRGPRGDGHAAAPGAEAGGLPLTWSETENVVWKTAIPHRGWSTPVVAQGQVWVTTATEDGRDYFALCIDARSGEILRTLHLVHAEKPEPLGNNMNGYASPSPAIEPGRVYLHFGSYGTACVDTATFEVLWQRRDLPCRHYRGPGSSVVLFRDFLILTMDGVDVQYLAALDKRTGRTVWKTARTTDWNDLDEHGNPFDNGDLRKGFTTPLFVETAAGTQMVSVGARSAYGYDPVNGAELWKVRYEGFSNASSPVYGNGMVVLSTGFSVTELWAVRLGGRGDITDTHVAWTSRRGAPRMPSPVLVDGLLFTVDDGGRASCFEADTGRQVFNERVSGDYAASLLYAEGRIYCFSQQGRTTVFRAAREFEVLADNRLDAGFMASPAVAGRALFLRTRTHLYRIEKKGVRPL